jgi:hypothetical protein
MSCVCKTRRRRAIHSADIHHPGFGHAIEQEMTRAVDPAGSSTGQLAAEEEMIGSAIISDLRRYAALMATAVGQVGANPELAAAISRVPIALRCTSRPSPSSKKTTKTKWSPPWKRNWRASRAGSGNDSCASGAEKRNQSDAIPTT